LRFDPGYPPSTPFPCREKKDGRDLGRKSIPQHVPFSSFVCSKKAEKGKKEGGRGPFRLSLLTIPCGSEGRGKGEEKGKRRAGARDCRSSTFSTFPSPVAKGEKGEKKRYASSDLQIPGLFSFAVGGGKGKKGLSLSTVTIPFLLTFPSNSAKPREKKKKKTGKKKEDHFLTASTAMTGVPSQIAAVT